MITKILETDRPVFFISDKLDFKPITISKENKYSFSDTTLSLMCISTADDMENVIHIYADEEYSKSNKMDLIVKNSLIIRSEILEISNSDAETIFELGVVAEKSNISVYANKDDEGFHYIFDIVIETK